MLAHRLALLVLLAACETTTSVVVPGVDTGAIGLGFTARARIFHEVCDHTGCRLDHAGGGTVSSDRVVVDVAADPRTSEVLLTGLSPGIGWIRVDDNEIPVAVEKVKDSRIEWFTGLDQALYPGASGPAFTGTEVRLAQRHKSPAGEILGELPYELDAGATGAELRFIDRQLWAPRIATGETPGLAVVRAGGHAFEVDVVGLDAIAEVKFYRDTRSPSFQPPYLAEEIDELAGPWTGSLVVVPIDAAGRPIAGCPDPELIAEIDGVYMGRDVRPRPFCEFFASGHGSGSVIIRYGDRELELPVNL